MSRLILLRHGQSIWNKKNIFTGWVDIPLSEEGIKESFESGQAIKNIPIDIVFTSTLIRGIMTAMIALSVHESERVPVILHPGEGLLESWGNTYGEKDSLIPVVKASELNERMYGKLQGLNKEAMRKEFGEEQIKIWRRSYDVAPPEGESLKMTAERTIPYFKREIVPHLEEGKNVLISAHGNSLRSIVMSLDNLREDEVVSLEIPTGKPLFYEYQNALFIKS